MTARIAVTVNTVIPEVCRFFDLGRLVRVKEIAECSHTACFIRTTRGDFLTKFLMEGEPLKRHRAEVRYMERVARHGIAVPSYIRSAEGETIFCSGRVLTAVQPEITGGHPEPTMSSVAQVGSILGSIRSVPHRSLPLGRGWLCPEHAERNIRKIKTAPDHFARRLIASYEWCKTFGAEVLPRLPQGIVHGDLHAGNVLFRKGALVSVLDWEDATVTASLLDFACGAIYWCYDASGRVRPRIYRRYRNAYAAERPFAELERRHLNDCLRYVATLQSMWRFLQYPEGSREGTLWAMDLEPLPES